MLKSLTVIILCLMSSLLGNPAHVQPKVSTDPSDLGHIFRNAPGHFPKDTLINRAFIESAAQSYENKVGTKGSGSEIYLKTFPNGKQAWAEVWEGTITNGGKNNFPKEWVPDNSKNGGHFITPKFSHYIKVSETFKGDLVVNNIKSAYERVCQVPQYSSLELSKIEGVAGAYGKILNFEESLDPSRMHTFYIPTYELTEVEAQQVLRDVARGIYIYEALPFFSLHFNRSLISYPVIPPVYRNTLIGEALGMLDYYMKGFVNGYYFEKDFIADWSESKSMSQAYLLEHAKDFHEYCESLGFHYQTFNEILEELMGDAPSSKAYKDCFNISYEMIIKQMKIYKNGPSFSYEGGFHVTGQIEGNPASEEEARHYDLLTKACSLMCDQIEEILPKLPICKKYFEVLYLANFFSYYCHSLKERGTIPLLDRSLIPGNQMGCPSAFPPLPVSLSKEIKLPIMAVIDTLNRDDREKLHAYLATPQATDQMIDDAYEAMYLGIKTYAEKEYPSLALVESQRGDLTFKLLEYCKTRYQVFKKNILLLLKQLKFQGATTNPNERARFFQYLDKQIAKERGTQKQNFINAKDAAEKWFQSPLFASFEDSGFLFSFLDGSIKFVNHCSGGAMELVGGCGAVVEDIQAEHFTWLGYFHRGISIKVDYEEMDIEENDIPQAVAIGYLYPPLPEYPFSHAVFNILKAIKEENLALFEKTSPGISDWNFKDPSGISLVHHAAQCKDPVFLKRLIEKGARLKVVDSQGLTPLHYAASVNNIGLIKILIEHFPELLDLRGEEGLTPLLIAVQNKHLHAVDTLLSLGANPNCKLINDMTPLLWAIQSKDYHIAMRLLAEDIDFNDCLRGGVSPVEIAIETKQLYILTRLIECGFNINRKCKGYTPLHLAIENRFVSGVRTLLECRDTVRTNKSSWGETPLEMAQRLGYQEIVELFVH
ncbi:MAG: ankyrin repeat domain-containing protein [Chlamydiales bacterium]|nr:ankyrin repeat domain-containing protein [Chlamydiales bacterium]